MTNTEITTKAPPCTDPRHKWREGDVDEVGGCDQNPGIFVWDGCRNGGIEHRQICDHCDTVRATYRSGSHAETINKREYIVHSTGEDEV